MPKDFYEILGVQRNASQEDIKRAFRNLAKEHHPDRGGDEKKFKEINSAYQVLGNPEKRQQYDQVGHSAYEQMGGMGGGSGAGFGGFDFSSFRNGSGGQGFSMDDLGDIFGGMFGGGGAQQGRRGARRGQHIEMDLPLSFEEAAFGVEKTVKPHKTVTCPDCEGTGAEKGSSLMDCIECGGRGQVGTVQRTIFGSFQSVRTCPRCEGEGKIPKKHCGKCGGAGVINDSREIKVKVPGGIGDGEVLRVSGEGAAVKGGASGDLYLNVRVRKHDRFRRDGYDVFSDEEISFPLASLGGKIDVKTLDGDVALKIPVGTQPGTVFRLRGKGISHLKRGGRGDHLVTVNVKVPTKLSRKQKKALEEWE